MQFTVARTLILDALRKVIPVTSGKQALPILGNVKFDAADGKVTFTTSDLDITVITTIPCNVIAPGASTLPAKLLTDAISRSAEGDIDITVDDATARATVKAGGSRFRISGLPAKEYPVLACDEECTTEFVVPQAVLKGLLKRTSYAISPDDTRRILTGVNFSFEEGKLASVATDGRRLAYSEYQPETPYSMNLSLIVPKKSVDELYRNLGTTGDVSFSLRKTLLFVKMSDSLTIATKLYDDVYPNYKQVIPKDNTIEIPVDRQMLISAIERVSVLSDADSVKFDIGNGNMTITSATADIGEARDEVPIKYDGEVIETRYNHNYLLDILKASEDDEVVFLFKDGAGPVIVKDSQPGLAVLMPLRTV